MLRSSKQSKLTFDLAVPYEMQDTHEELKDRIDEMLAAAGRDYKTVIKFDWA